MIPNRASRKSTCKLLNDPKISSSIPLNVLTIPTKALEIHGSTCKPLNDPKMFLFVPTTPLSATAALPVLPVAPSMSVPNKMVISSMNNVLKFCNDASDCCAYSDLVKLAMEVQIQRLVPDLWFSRN